jgi:hypothetical protein
VITFDRPTRYRPLRAADHRQGSDSGPDRWDSPVGGRSIRHARLSLSRKVRLRNTCDDCSNRGEPASRRSTTTQQRNAASALNETQTCASVHRMGPHVLKPGISLLVIVLLVSPSQAKSSPSRRLVGVWQVAEVNGKPNDIAGTVEFRSERPMVLTWDGCNRGQAATYSVVGSVLRVTNTGGVEGVRKTMRYCGTPKTPGLVEILRRKPRVMFLKDGAVKLSSPTDPALSVKLR